jgi:hypothetical protein
LRYAQLLQLHASTAVQQQVGLLLFAMLAWCRYLLEVLLSRLVPALALQASVELCP